MRRVFHTGIEPVLNSTFRLRFMLRNVRLTCLVPAAEVHKYAYLLGGVFELCVPFSESSKSVHLRAM